MRRRLIAACCLAVLAGAGPAYPNLLTQDPCGGETPQPEVFAQSGIDVLENLLFTGDELWISNASAGAVDRLDPAGERTGRLGDIPSPGGLLERDGRIYIGFGNSAFNALTRTPDAGVLSVDLEGGDRQGVAGGLTMANGMIADPAGNLYVSNDFDTRLYRIEPGGEWTIWSDAYGTNGLVVIGDDLYAAVTFDQRSPILRIPLDDPAAAAVAAQLSFGAASLEPAVHTDGDPSQPLLGVKGLDDMTLGPDGMLYVTANGTGELLQVDPATGDTCLVAAGLQNPSSVRVAPAGGPFAGPDPDVLDLYVTEFSGAVKVVRHRPE